MSGEIHRVVQDSYDLDTFSSRAIEDDVPAFVITIRGANEFIAFFPPPRIVGKRGESIFKLFYVVEALLPPPFFVRVTANVS